MLYYLNEWREVFSPLRIFQYITVRAFAAAATAFILSLILGPAMIRFLVHLKIGQQIRGADEMPLYQLHTEKAGTPTMGGLLIISSTALATLLWAVPTNGFVWIALTTFCVMGGIGFCDDYLKVSRKKSKGLGARAKLGMQGAWTVVIVLILLNWSPTADYARQIMVPFLKEPILSDVSAWGVAIFIFLVLVGSTNAVNLTDGLDGLAIGCSNAAAAAYFAMAYVAGHAIFAQYLQVPYIPGSGELAVFCGALLGGGLGFLWFNCYPARVFMGDTGSLALGGALAIVAILINQELTLVIVGGVFVMEAMSVLIQVGSYKMRGKRVFKCAPIHHHFEILAREKAEKAGRVVGLVETTITIRFWILAMVFAIIGLATLKIR
jgi:phospho-N-acetylmuramoyl-pentapeptide-transferase